MAGAWDGARSVQDDAGAAAFGAGRGARSTAITVTSKSVPSDLQVPVDYSCDGKDLSPQLTWSAPPEGTKALVVVLDDPDASGGTFTHWLVIDPCPPDDADPRRGGGSDSAWRQARAERLPQRSVQRPLPTPGRDAPVPISRVRLGRRPSPERRGEPPGPRRGAERAPPWGGAARRRSRRSSHSDVCALTARTYTLKRRVSGSFPWRVARGALPRPGRRGRARRD